MAVGETVYAYSKRGNEVGQVQVSTVVHSAGYTYTQYGPIAPHQKNKGGA